MKYNRRIIRKTDKEIRECADGWFKWLQEICRADNDRDAIFPEWDKDTRARVGVLLAERILRVSRQ